MSHLCRADAYLTSALCVLNRLLSPFQLGEACKSERLVVAPGTSARNMGTPRESLLRSSAMEGVATALSYDMQHGSRAAAIQAAAMHCIKCYLHLVNSTETCSDLWEKLCLADVTHIGLREARTVSEISNSVRNETIIGIPAIMQAVAEVCSHTRLFI